MKVFGGYPLLLCFVSCSIVAASTSMPHLSIVAQPSSIKEGQTPYLMVNCTFDHLAGTQFDALAYLTLYKSATNDINDNNYKEVAQISSTLYRVVTKDDLGATSISGVLNARSTSFIAYEWVQPNDSVKGRYMCEAQGMTNTGQPVTSNGVATVSGIVADFNILLQKINQLNATLLQQSGGGTANVDGLEKKLNTLELLLNQQTGIINNQSAQIASLSNLVSSKEALINNQSIQIHNLESKFQSQLTNDCCNQTAQNEIKLKDLQYQLDNYGYRLDIEIVNKLDNLNATVNQNTKEVSTCIAEQTKYHDQISNQTSRIDEVMSMQKNQTSQLTGMLLQLDNSRTSVMQSSNGFNGKYYFMSRPMWRNTAAFEGLCQLYGGHIVEVDDQAEFDFLSQFIQGNNVTETVVIGGTDQGNEGNWRFQASGRPMVYSNWAAHSPSRSVWENCVMLDVNAGWKMQNTECDAKQWSRFICEMAI